MQYDIGLVRLPACIKRPQPIEAGALLCWVSSFTLLGGHTLSSAWMATPQTTYLLWVRLGDGPAELPAHSARPLCLSKVRMVEIVGGVLCALQANQQWGAAGGYALRVCMLPFTSI